MAIPAHNELRYAGDHFLRVMSDAGGIEDLAQLRKAIAHCERSMYEASEAGIIYALERIQSFKQDYKSVVISSAVKDWVGILDLADRSRHLLVSARAQGSPTDNSSRYIGAVRGPCEKMPVARPCP